LSAPTDLSDLDFLWQGDVSIHHGLKGKVQLSHRLIDQEGNLGVEAMTRRLTGRSMYTDHKIVAQDLEHCSAESFRVITLSPPALSASRIEVPSDATAFGDRSMGWMHSLDGVWSDPVDNEADMAWSRLGWSNSAAFGHHGRAYLNFPGHGEDGAALTRTSFGASFQRLIEIKTKYDPKNRFRFNQNIPPQS
jgi:FAD/FMN-containing dehydrogenase